MQSGFNSRGAGGLPEFYTGVGGARSIGGNNMDNNNNNHHPHQPQFHNRSQTQGIFIDSSIPQIGPHRQSQNPANLIGKRTLAEFQYHQQNPYQQNLTNQQSLYLQSLKQRTANNFQHSSPISTLSPIDLSSSGLSYTASDNSSSSTNSSMLSQRYGLPLLQQLRPNQIISSSFPVNSSPCLNNNSLQNLQPPHQNQSTIPNRVSVSMDSEKKALDSEKKMIDDRLHELEKQLLDDNDDDEEAGHGVSVITNPNSEWSETMHSLIGANPTTQKPVSPSPTSSSSSSSSVASPATLTCSKQTLMDAASAIADGKPDAAAEILTRVTQVTNPKPNSEQRLLEFMTSALKSKVNPAPVAELWSVEHAGSTQFLYELLPCYRLGFMAANIAILEATLAEPTTTNRVHVIDFDIGQGSQYKHLLHALSTRGKPSVVKITTVAESGGEEKLRAVRESLTQVAKQQSVGLEFNVVSHKLSELTRESLGCDPDEPIAVNFAFKLYSMPDESVTVENPRDELLRRVKELAPRVVTLVEQELNTNTAPFMARVKECCAYYGTMLDSVETLTKEGLDRVKAEETLSRKLANSVACEGKDRVERCEVFGKWRARMGMAGFELKPMSPNVTESLKERLSPGSRATVKETNGAVSFGWISRTLTVASAWR